MLNNKWTGGRTSWTWESEFPWSNLNGFSGGIAPLQAILDPKVGMEVALFIVDYTDYADEIAQTQPFRLHLKSGLVTCPSGPVLFFLFWLPNPRMPQIPVAAFESTVNPHNPNHMQPYRDLARQTHWHAFIVGLGDELLNWFEFENEFNINSTLDAADKYATELPCRDFDKAKFEFEQRYSSNDLFELS